MTTIRTLPLPDSFAVATGEHNQHAADALVAAVRKPLDVLHAAAEEAASGRLGAAKLGLLVAAHSLIEALRAVDAEFARRYDTRLADAASCIPTLREVGQPRR